MSIKTPLRYAGGKSRAIKIITPLIPKDTKRIISPFAGGCSLEIYWANNLPVDEVIAYDVFDILVNFWNVILTNPKGLADALEVHKTQKDYYYEQKQVLKDHFTGTKIIKDKVELASQYYYNHQLSYGPMFLGWASSVYLNEKNYSKIIKNVREFKCPKLKVKLGTFDKSIPKHNNDFLYLDPPYYTSEENGNKMFKAIYPNSNFPIHHKGFDHENLRDLLFDHRGQYIMSYNDCPTIREWYKKDEQQFPKWHYSFQQGETRIGKNRIDAGVEHSKKDSHEILILNVEKPKLSNDPKFLQYEEELSVK